LANKTFSTSKHAAQNVRRARATAMVGLQTAIFVEPKSALDTLKASKLTKHYSQRQMAAHGDTPFQHQHVQR